MSEKTVWPCKKGMKKIILGQYLIYLGHTWDLTHGKGWFARAYKWGRDRWIEENTILSEYSDGFGHSKNKFTAVRQAINNIKLD